MKVEATAKLSNLRMSPRKVRLITNLIRGQMVLKAIAQLQALRKDAVRPVLKLLRSAIANAEHKYELKEKDLKIKSALTNGGPILYRSMPRAMGRATPIRKRTSHIEIILEGETLEKKKKE